MPKSKKVKRSPRRWLNREAILMLSLAVLLVVLSAFTYAQINKDSNSSEVSDSSDLSGQDGEYVNLDPPTEEEKKQTEDHKKNLSEFDNPPDSGASVMPVITFADQNEVKGYVTGVFEDGGTCTAVATKGSQTITATSKGFTDVNKTTCAPMKWALSDGGWSVTLSYSSTKASGKSEAVMVN